MDKKKQGRPKPKPLLEWFEGLPDPRMDRTRHNMLVDILAIGLCSLLTGGESFTDMEFYGRLQEDWRRYRSRLFEGFTGNLRCVCPAAGPLYPRRSASRLRTAGGRHLPAAARISRPSWNSSFIVLVFAAST